MAVHFKMIANLLFYNLSQIVPHKGTMLVYFEVDIVSQVVAQVKTSFAFYHNVVHTNSIIVSISSITYIKSH